MNNLQGVADSTVDTGVVLCTVLKEHFFLSIILPPIEGSFNKYKQIDSVSLNKPFMHIYLKAIHN